MSSRPPLRQVDRNGEGRSGGRRGAGRDRRRRAQAHAHAGGGRRARAELAAKTLAATAEGHLTALEWASRWPNRRWALEDCRHLTRTLERDLIAPARSVVRVPTRMMAGVRRSARQPGKSDAIDALAVARAAWLNPICQPPRSTGPRARCGCWSTIATTSSPSEPACRAESAGICTRLAPDEQIRTGPQAPARRRPCRRPARPTTG